MLYSLQLSLNHNYMLNLFEYSFFVFDAYPFVT